LFLSEGVGVRNLESQITTDGYWDIEKELDMSRLALFTFLIFLTTPLVLAQQPEENPPAKESIPADSSTENPSRATQLLRSYQTIRIETGTWLAKPEMCEGALQKHHEFEAWELSIVRSGRADVVIKIDHQPGWFYYQYSMVHSATQVVLASGNITAWDGAVACSMVADAIIERTKQARPKTEPKNQKDKKATNVELSMQIAVEPRKVRALLPLKQIP
jgi:hypothetical protein